MDHAHGDAVVRRCEAWLQENFRDVEAVSEAVDYAGIPERTLKRRFKGATGCSLIEYLQNLRIEDIFQTGLHEAEASHLIHEGGGADQ